MTTNSRVLLLSFLIAVSGLIGCAGTPSGGSISKTSSPADRLPGSRPVVVSLTPSPRATGVSLNTVVTATFSKDVNPSTINVNTFFIKGLTGTVMYDPTTRTATFTPSTNLQANSTYSGTITSAVADSGGVPLATDFAFTFTTEQPSGAGSGGDDASVQDLIYTTDQTSGDLSGWVFNTRSNTSSTAPGSPYSSGVGPASMAAGPNGNYLFAVLQQQAPTVRASNCYDSPTQVASYAINHDNGSLVLVQQFELKSYCAHGIAIDATGKYLYVSGSTTANEGLIEEIAVDATAHMSEAAGSPYVVGAELPGRLVVSPDGRHVYATAGPQLNDTTSILVFSRDAMTGAVKFQSSLSNGTQVDLALSPSGTTLVSADWSAAKITAYTVDPDSGAIAANQTTTLGGTHVRQLVVDSAGRFCAVAGDAGINLYAINAPGMLSQVGDSPQGKNAISVSFDPKGDYLAALAAIPTNAEGDGIVTVYKVNRDAGTLQQVATDMQTKEYPAYVLMLGK